MVAWKGSISDLSKEFSGYEWRRYRGLARNYKTINAEEQMGRTDSVFAFYKEMIALRKNAAYQATRFC